MMCRMRWGFVRTSILLVLSLAPSVRAELTSDELLLIYNRNSPESERIARYYAARRGVPDDRLLGLDLPAQEDIPRTAYDREMVTPIRRHLWDRNLADKVRCLVTFYDVPLRVGRRLLTKAESERLAWVQKQLDEFGAQIDRSVNLAQVLAEGATGERVEQIQQMSRRDKGMSEVRKAFANYRRGVSRRLSGMADQVEAAKIRESFLDAALVLDGLAGVDRSVGVEPDLLDERVAARLRELKDRQIPPRDRIARLLGTGMMQEKYERGIELLRKRSGAAAAFGQLDRERRRWKFDRTPAAVDSELALIWWRPYRLHMMLFNWLNAHARNQAVDDEDEYREIYSEPVLMVSRLDGPSPDVVRRMIDHSIEVEKTGLSGTFYLDRDPSRRSRALVPMERAMGKAALFLQEDPKDNMHVVVDDSEQLFPPGSCPKTALYCGWYSLMNYVDAFQFVPGAVAYHVASGEAISLRDPTKAYWCKEMLARGAAATLGPVHEPFLQSMPRPDRFFGLLMTGQFTLAETFALSNPNVSWMVILIGDPLYTPFKANPLLRVEGVLKSTLLPVDFSRKHFAPIPKQPDDEEPQ